MAVLAALLVGGGWWAVRGPMVDQPVAVVPEVDLDSVAMHPAGDAAGVAQLAATWQGPSASTPLAARAASAASGANEASCGEDGGPKFAEPEERDGMWTPSQAQIRGATPGFIAAQARIDAALRGSPDPLDRAAADFLNAGDSRTPSGSIDALVQQASSTQDPRVYSLALRACEFTRLRFDMLQQKEMALPPSCATLDAHRWASLDPGNGMPWLWVLARANQARDAAAQRDAFAHLAAANRFDYQPMGVAAAVARHTAVDEDGSAALAMMGKGLAEASMAFPQAVGLVPACRAHAGGDEALEQQCAAIAKTLYDHSDSLLLPNWAISITFALDGDATRRDAARAAMARLYERVAANAPDAPCAALRYTRQRFIRSNEIGELSALRELAASAPAKP